MHGAQPCGTLRLDEIAEARHRWRRHRREQAEAGKRGGVGTVIGAALAGAGAILYGMFIRAAQFTLDYQAGLRAFTAAVLGGIGNIPGAVLGGFLIGIIEALSDYFFQSQWTQAVVFGVLIIILVFRPSGLLGQRVAEKV